MNILSLPVTALAWLGRQGTRALAVSIFVGLRGAATGGLRQTASRRDRLCPAAVFLFAHRSERVLPAC